MVVHVMNVEAAKSCVTCGRTIEWQPRWARCWDRVRYCSPRCRRHTLDETDRALEHAVLGLLSCQPVGGTVAPAEAARLVADGGPWWRLVERAHWAVRRLAAEDRVEVVDDVAPGDAAGGPVRVRLPGGIRTMPWVAAV